MTTNTPEKQSGARLNVKKAGPMALFKGGSEAIKSVPGLKGFVVRGFLLNYLVFMLIAALGMGLLYQYAVAPLLNMVPMPADTQGFMAVALSWFAKVMLWVLNIVLMGATLLLSFLVSLSLMSLWYEALAGRIVAHFRGSEESAAQRFSLGRWLAGLTRSLKDSLVLLLLSLLALSLGFIPLVGPLLVPAINSYLLGREVRDPYLVVRMELGDDPAMLTRGLKLWTLRIGMAPMLLGFIPVVGWLFLPLCVMYLVAGVAWESEQQLKSN